jgi:hypothetical protein
MKIFQKNTYLIVLSREEAVQLNGIDNIDQYYSEKYSGYVFSPMINHTNQLLTQTQVTQILDVINVDKTIEITDKLTLINA